MATAARARVVVVELPVRDLERAKAFFARLGFAFDPELTDDDEMACMIVGQTTYVMLLGQPWCRRLTRAQLLAAAARTEAILALSCGSGAK